jgi:MFS family permease
MNQIREVGMDMQYPKYRWFVCVTMFIGITAQGMLLIAPAPLVKPISESLGLSLGQTSAMLLMLFTLFTAISGIVGGAIADKIGLPALYVACMSPKIIGSFFILTAGNTVPLVILGRFFCGIGSGPTTACGAKLANEWFPRSERATITGFGSAALAAGIMIGANVSPQVFAATGNWNQAVASNGLLAIPALFMAIIFLKGPKPPMPNASDQAGIQEAVSPQLKVVFAQFVFYVGIFTAFCSTWVRQTYNNLVPGMLAVDLPVGLGYGSIIAGQLMGVSSLLNIVGAFLSGIIMHAIFKDKARKFIAITYVLLAISCALLLVPIIGANKVLLSVCIFITGFLSGIPLAAVQGFIALNYPKSVIGKVGGITVGIGVFGGSVGISIGSFALHMTESYRIPIVTIAVAAVVGSLMALMLKKPAVFENQAES